MVPVPKPIDPEFLRYKAERHLLQLISEERIQEARGLVSQMEVPAQWTRILAPPKATVGTQASGRGITDQAALVADELARYSGQWVAIREGKDRGFRCQPPRPEEAAAGSGVTRRLRLSEGRGVSISGE